MKIAILETVVPSGHEVEYDRGLVKELVALGHEPVFFVPKNYPFKADYGTDIEYLSGGTAISYSGAGFVKKAFLSLMREFRRRCWFNSACKIAKDNGYSLIIIPTATPRYLKAILTSKLCNSAVPVVINLQVFSFEKNGRLEQFIKLSKKLLKYKNIYITITSPNHFISNLPNVSYIDPPFYKPSLIIPRGMYDGHKPIILGLYGFLRRDSNVEKLLNIFATSEFKTPFKVVIQTVTNNEKDSDFCKKILSLYKNNPIFEFTHTYLKGESWQKALDETDVILAPYNSKQYVYTYSAMCFSALGFNKPVILSSNVNPEVINEFNVGLCLDFEDDSTLKESVVTFIDSFEANYSRYIQEISKAAEKYNFRNVVNAFISFAITDK